MVPDSVVNALFVVVGLMLIKQTYALTGHVRRFLPRAMLHGVAGLTALLAANTVGSLFGLGVGLNGLTIPLSAGLGAPGVTLLWAVKYLI